MATLHELLAQRATLEMKIAEVQREERSHAITKVKGLMTEYGLTLADLGTRVASTPRRNAGGGGGKKVPAKYRNSMTGETWSGRGLKPNWLKAALNSGRSLADFTIS